MSRYDHLNSILETPDGKYSLVVELNDDVKAKIVEM
jgi:hypothetical protein